MKKSIKITNFTHFILSRINDLINTFVNLILHNKKFQELEASWRGLALLAEHTASFNKKVKIKLWNISWSELSRDLHRATEFDQSQLFIKLYNNEFGHPGGEPFGLLVGDYQISHRNLLAGTNDIRSLQYIVQIAASAFVPFITAAHPSLFGIDNFTSFERSLDLARTFQQNEYQLWQSLRNDEDARFIGLVLPYILMRKPYSYQNAKRYPFYFHETTTQAEHYLWGNAAYCLAVVTARAFANTGWFAEMRGARNNQFDQGVITQLPRDRFATGPCIFSEKFPISVNISDQLEKNLAEHGFICLTTCKYSFLTAFYSCPTLQQAKFYGHVAATQNAKISSLLPYILCMSRFAHYLKIIARDKIGSFISAQDCENYLQQWLQQYTADNSNLSDELKAKYPLRLAKVKVHEKRGHFGTYQCVIHLAPHYQFDEVETYLQLNTEFIKNS